MSNDPYVILKTYRCNRITVAHASKASKSTLIFQETPLDLRVWGSPRTHNISHLCMFTATQATVSHGSVYCGTVGHFSLLSTSMQTGWVGASSTPEPTTQKLLPYSSLGDLHTGETFWDPAPQSPALASWVQGLGVYEFPQTHPKMWKPKMKDPTQRPSPESKPWCGFWV